MQETKRFVQSHIKPRWPMTDALTCEFPDIKSVWNNNHIQTATVKIQYMYQHANFIINILPFL